MAKQSTTSSKKVTVQDKIPFVEVYSYAEAIAETVREPLIVLDKDLRVVSASRAFYENFKVAPEETEERFIYDLGNGQWDIPELRKMLEDILPHNTRVQDYEVTHKFQTIGSKTMLLNAREIRNKDEDEFLILLAIADISKQRKAEKNILVSEEKYRSLFNSMDEGFCIIEFFDGPHGPLSDYVHIEANPAYTINAGIPDIVGKKVREMVPDEADGWVEIYRKVLITGEPVRFQQELIASGRYLELSAFRIGPAEQKQVAVLFTDITERKKAEEKKEFLLTLNNSFSSISDAVEIVEAASYTTMAHFKADRCYYCEIMDGKVVIRRDAATGNLPSVAGVYALNEFPIFKSVVEAGSHFAVEDIRVSNIMDETLKQLSLQMQVISFVAVPVVKDKKTVGILSLTQTRPRKWAIEDMHLIQETAERTWAAVERTQAETALETSEKKYRTLFDSMDEGYCIIEMLFDDKGKPFDWYYWDVNPAFEKHNGLSNAKGKNILQMVPDIEPKWFKIYGDVALTGRPVRFEEDSTALNRYFDLYAFRVGNPEAHTVAVLFNDITTRKQAEEALRQSEDKYSSLVNQAVAGIFMLDASGKIIFTNERFAEMMDYSKEELSQKYMADLVYEKDRQRHHEKFEAMKNDGNGYTIEKRMLRKDGTHFWVNNYNSPIFNDNGKLRAVSIVSVDISHQKAIEKKKDDFISIASHELKTPLTSIKAYGEILQENFSEKGESDAKMLVERLNAQITRLNKLVHGLLDTNNISAGRLALQKEDFDLNLLIEERVAEVQLTTSSHQLIIKSQKIPLLHADPERIGQVLTNLITNAIKYSPDAHEVWITSESKEHEVRVSIRDFGMGMDGKYLEKIFKRFYQIRSSGKSSTGLGLGLYISMEIIKLHGGDMGVESEPGYGAVFYFTIPIAPEERS